MKIRVFVGSGGVGKTSVTAASALADALSGRKTLVLTIDPALRLKTALGLTGEAGVSQRVALEAAVPGGELHAALLDVEGTMDRMVRSHAGAKAAAILDHSVYRLLITSLAGMNELVAVERIDQAIEDGFENIYIDTAPSRHAFEFLDKPEFFVELVSVPLVKLVGRTWNLWRKSPLARLDSMGTDLYSRLQQLVGATLVAQVLDFFSIFYPVAEGFGKRARHTIGLLRDARTTGFTIVTTASGARRDAAYLFAELAKRNYHPELLVLNRMWPELGVQLDSKASGPAQDLVRWCEDVTASQRGVRDRVRAEWGKKGLRVIDLPELAGDADGLPALRQIAEALDR